MNKTCTRCGVEWPNDRKHFPSCFHTCRECANRSIREWNKRERKKGNARFKEYRKRTIDKTKAICEAAYGNKCVCCGLQKRLTYDHVNNDGAEHRLEIGHSTDALMVWMKRNNFPDTIQRLCYSCNTVKSKIILNPDMFFSPASLERVGNYWTLVTINGYRLIKPNPKREAVEYRKRQIEFFKNNPQRLGTCKKLC